jgi:tetratricopeptide (TPR) repeat protein
VAYPDTPLELRDDGDRDQATDALDAMPLGPARDAARAPIADALADRLADALADDHPFLASALLQQLAELWQRDPEAIGAGLAAHLEVLKTARATFARSGESESAILALVMLGEVEPAQRTQHAAEIDEILAFSDDLAVADAGADAARAQPIALLQPTAMALPLHALVDRYVALLVERQRVINAVLLRGKPTAQTIHAHHDILSTSRRIGSALARSGRPEQIHARLDNLDGVGIDHDVATRADILAEHASPDAYVELARTLRDAEHAGDPSSAGDTTAALATCVAGLVRYPGNADLLEAAAGHAQALGRVDQAIALLRAIATEDPSFALRLGRLYAERIGRLASSGRPNAAETAWRELGTVAARDKRNVDWTDALAHAEAALGRGLVAAGDLEAGQRALSHALELAPNVDAYETSALVEMQTGHFGAATQSIAHGLALLADTAGDRYRRAKLQRLAGDALRRANHLREAGEAYLDALRTWASLGDARDLPRPIAAERMLESGQILWWMEDHGRSTELLLRAVDVDDDTATTAAGAVAFLLEVGQPAEAAEAFHRVLGSAGISEYYKVYMGLWLVGDAQRRGDTRDRQANDYLASRKGRVWYELLAEAATGRAGDLELRAAATTAPRRAELAFYGATLGIGVPAHEAHADPGKRELLEQVVDARLVLDAEYDLARKYLGR